LIRKHDVTTTYAERVDLSNKTMLVTFFGLNKEIGGSWGVMNPLGLFQCYSPTHKIQQTRNHVFCQISRSENQHGKTKLWWRIATLICTLGISGNKRDVRNTSMSYNTTEILLTLWVAQIGNVG